MNQVKKGLSMAKDSVKGFVNEEDGVGVVEVILIMVVLIGLVVVFKDKIGEIVNRALGQISEDAGSITD